MTTPTAGDDQVAALAALLSGDFDSYQRRLSHSLGQDPAWDAFPDLMDAVFREAVLERFGPAADPAAIADFTERMRTGYDLKPPVVSWLLRAAADGVPPRPDRPLTRAEQLDVASTQVVLLYELASEAGLPGRRLGHFRAMARAMARATVNGGHASIEPAGAQQAAVPPIAGPPSAGSAHAWAPGGPLGGPPPARRPRSRRKVIALAAVAIVVVALGTRPMIALIRTIGDNAHPLPTAAANLVAALDAGPDEAITASDDQVKMISKAAGLFAGPHFDWQFGLVQVTDLTPVSGYDGELAAAAPGDEFIAIYADPGTRAQFQAEPGDHLTAAVLVNGSARAVPKQVLTDFEGLVISVPKGATATLRVTDDGRTQSYDLRAGKRGPDAIGGYSRSQHVTPSGDAGYTGDGTCPDVLVPYIGALPCSVHIDLLIENESFSLQPWLPVLGWAKNGRAWLLIGSVTNLPDAPPITIAPGGGSFTLEATKTFTVRLPDGTSIGLVPQSAAAYGSSSSTDGASLVFDVPASFTAGTLLIHPDGKLIVTGQPGHWSQPPPVKPVPLTLGP